MVEYEEKKAKMLEEYNKCIYEKADKLPITKIHYRVSSSQDPTMRIPRDHDPLNVTVESEFHITSTIKLIRLQKDIILDSPEAKEMYKLMELEIEARDDVEKARKIVKDNLDGLGQHM
nr:hypothetical protein [Tanacetum cinerariifolium]